MRRNVLPPENASATDTPSRQELLHLPWETGSEQPQIGIPHKRHSFAVRTLVGWYRAGLDVEALLPRLSTYLGHREPRFTYRYLTATPELLGHAAARLEAAQEAIQ